MRVLGQTRASAHSCLARALVFLGFVSMEHSSRDFSGACSSLAHTNVEHWKTNKM